MIEATVVRGDRFELVETREDGEEIYRGRTGFVIRPRVFRPAPRPDPDRAGSTSAP